MKQNKLIIIISIILAVLILVMLLAFFITSNNSNSNKQNSNANDNNQVIEENTENQPQKNNFESSIELSLENEAKNLDEVNILINVSDDINEDYEIILPDGTVSEGSITEYSVTQNGEYKFIFVFSEDNKIEKTIEVSNLKEVTEEENVPAYIPKDFSYKTGTIDTGYVIEDQYGNEFVWVPVETGVMTRKNSKKSNYIDNESKVKAFINSVLNYHGFYISRYEASKAELDGVLVATSFYNVEPWNNASFKEAREYADNFCSSFGYRDVRSTLTSSYAWDTTLNWLNHAQKSYSTSLDFGNYSETINNTGSTEKDVINNICDMAGNLKEWTTEIYTVTSEDANNTDDAGNTTDSNILETNTNENITTSEGNLRVLRGGSINLAKPATSQISFSEHVTDETWGFRLVLYK